MPKIDQSSNKDIQNQPYPKKRKQLLLVWKLKHAKNQEIKYHLFTIKTQNNEIIVIYSYIDIYRLR